MAKDSSGFLERRFQLAAHGTNVRTEVAAGITTFLTMAYIIFVNPGIVSSAIPGMPFQAVMIGTIVAAAFATVIMAFHANYPIALAPGMGLNAYFAFTVVGAMGVPWETALGAVSSPVSSHLAHFDPGTGGGHRRRAQLAQRSDRSGHRVLSPSSASKTAESSFPIRRRLSLSEISRSRALCLPSSASS